MCGAFRHPLSREPPLLAAAAAFAATFARRLAHGRQRSSLPAGGLPPRPSTSVVAADAAWSLPESSSRALPLAAGDPAAATAAAGAVAAPRLDLLLAFFDCRSPPPSSAAVAYHFAATAVLRGTPRVATPPPPPIAVGAPVE